MDRRVLLQALGVGVLGALSACSPEAVGGAPIATSSGSRTSSSSASTTRSASSTSRVTVPSLTSSTSTTSTTVTSTEDSPSPESSAEPPASSEQPATSEQPPPEPPPPAADQPPPGDPIGARIPRPGTVIDSVPGGLVALTIDDGTSSEIVSTFVDLLNATGLRMTFFVNGVYDSWADNATRLQPLIEAGQVQLGNHTWDHPYITKISADEVRDQITRNEQRIVDLYGVNPRPYFRPPYGAYNDATNQICADLGYPAITLWNSQFGDYTQITGAQIMANARDYLNSGAVILGHANYPMVSGVFDQIAQLIHDRGLTTVTLNDVYLP